jgi:hypothetical protein
MYSSYALISRYPTGYETLTSIYTHTGDDQPAGDPPCNSETRYLDNHGS